MKIWVIAWKDTLIRLRDRRGFIIMLLMPLLLTMILGNALSGVINEGANTLPEMTVAVYDGDGGELAKGLVDGVLQSDGLKDRLTLEKKSSEEEVRAAVADGKAAAGIVIPAGLTESMAAGKDVKIGVLEDPGKATAGQIVRSIVSSYTARVGVVSGTAEEVLTELGKSAVPVTAGAEGAKASGGSAGSAGSVSGLQQQAGKVVGELKAVAMNPNVGVIEAPVGENPISAKQYYAAAMTAMFVLYNAAIGAKLIVSERLNETLARMMSTPTSKGSILLGKFFGTLLFSVLQFTVMVLATKSLFGVDWGANLGQVFAVGVMYAVAVAGLSMTVASLIKTEKAADMVMGIGVQICAILGGSMEPLASFPETMQKVALVTPNTWALNSFVEIMSGTTWQALLMPMTVLLAIGAAALTVGTWRLAAR